MADQSEETLLETIEAGLAAGGATPPPAPIVAPAPGSPEPAPTPIHQIPPQPAPAPAVDPAPAPAPDFKLSGKLAAAAELVKAGVPEAEAVTRVFGEGAPAPQVPAEPPPPDPLIAKRDRLAELQEILETQADAGTVLTREILEAMDERAALRAEIAQTEAERAAQQQHEAQRRTQEWDTKWNESEKWAVQRFPDAANPESALSKAVTARLQEISGNESHPLYGNPELPKLLYAEEAANLGLTPAKAAPGAEPQPRIFPASPMAKTTPPNAVNPATIRAEFESKQAEAARTGDAQALADLAELELTGQAPSHRESLRVA